MVDKKILEALNILADHNCIDCWHYQLIVSKDKMNHYCKKYLLRKKISWSDSCSNFKQTTPVRFFYACKRKND